MAVYLPSVIHCVTQLLQQRSMLVKLAILAYRNTCVMTARYSKIG